MEITAAILADFAQVREGVLFVGSGGISRMARPAFPASMNSFLALMIEVPFDQIRRAHEVTVTIRDLDHQQIAEIRGGFAMPPQAIDLQLAALDPGESLQVPMSLDLRMIGVPAPGSYTITITVDDDVTRTLSFKVLQGTTWPPQEPPD